MKVLLDESLDRRVRSNLGVHHVFSVGYMGWSGLKNGKLLDAAELDGFDILLTGDQSLYQEQNFAGRRLAVVATSTVEWQIIKDHLPKIIEAIESAEPGSYTAVDCGRFNRKRQPSE